MELVPLVELFRSNFCWLGPDQSGAGPRAVDSEGMVETTRSSLRRELRIDGTAARRVTGAHPHAHPSQRPAIRERILGEQRRYSKSPSYSEEGPGFVLPAQVCDPAARERDRRASW